MSEHAARDAGGVTRRSAIRTGAVVVAGLGLAPAFWRTGRVAAGVPVTPGAGPYGPLQAADANGIMLPKGFRSRVVAQGRAPVAGTSYLWHDFSDGAATFATPDGGWILVSNSETVPQAGGGVSAVRFARDGSIADAYRILGGTTANCAGGPTPWGTWLSCEEIEFGQVWECDPTGARDAVALPALGRFNHEAAAVDPDGEALYLTEDVGDGGFYRFVPADYPDLSAGRLDVAIVAGDGRVTWVAVPDPTGRSAPTRRQVEGMTRFKRGEGIWFDAGVVYVATTSDSKVHAYDTRAERMTVIYDKAALADPPLLNPDNLTVSSSGDIFVAEDSGEDDPLDLGIITPEGEIARFLKFTGPQHGRGEAISEVAGPVFDPSGTRLYVSSQRAFGTGQVYEITGPFRQGRAAGAPLGGVRDPAPVLGLVVPRRRTRRVFLRRGIPVALTLDEPAEVTVVLRTTLRAAGRTRTVTLGRRSESLGRGPALLRVGLDARARERIGGRRRLRVTAEVAIRAGGTTTRRRRVIAIRARPPGGRAS